MYKYFTKPEEKRDLSSDWVFIENLAINKKRNDFQEKLANIKRGDKVITAGGLKGIIKDFKFEGEGCIVSQAGTSIISEMVLGKEIDEILNMGPELMSDILGEELTLSRPKCSTLGISTLKLAIKEIKRNELKKLI